MAATTDTPLCAERTQHQSEGDAELGLFKDIARLAPAMLWVSDKHGAMTFLNDRYLRFTGLREAQAKAPESWPNQVHPEDRETATRAFVDGHQNQCAFSVEFRLRQQDGSFSDVLALAHPRRNDAGEFDGYVGATFDISERKLQELALRESNRVTEEHSRELNLLYELKSDLQVCRSVDETTPVLVKYCEQLFDGRSARILLHNNSRDLVEPFLSLGANEHASDMFPPESCWALRKGKSHLEQTTRVGSICPNARDCAHASYLCLPMKAFGETIGILQIDVPPSAATSSDTARDSDIAAAERVGSMVADEIAAAIEELKVRAKLHQQSIRDPLTHLYNRRYLLEALERELYRAQDNDSELAVLMLDLDHFKSFNDTHGHNGGDLILREFGKVLQATIRGGDIACRYGGEEFAVLMVACPPDGALKRAEEIRRATEKLTLDYHGTTLDGVTTSIGMATSPHDATSLDELIIRADAALYVAKKAGRNRISTHSRIPENQVVEVVSAA